MFSSTLAHWVHDLDPFVIQFGQGFGIRWYGLAYVLGFIGGAWLVRQAARAQRFRVPTESISDLMMALIIGVMVGGRLGYFILYHPDWLLSEPLVLFRIWEGGMASHGGFLGVAAAMAWYAHKQHVTLLHVGDAVIPAVPLGLMLGRIANFINGELWGRVTTVRWGVIFPESAPPGTPVELIPARHPSQLYAAALEGLLLLVYLQWRFWRTPVVARQPGRLSGEFLIGYAIVRAISEQFRQPDAEPILGLTRGTFYSILVALVGLFLIWRATRSQALAAVATTTPQDGHKKTQKGTRK
jgi:phosphatidylglycerol---prolipoprotein diacylglyceryl transferase